MAALLIVVAIAVAPAQPPPPPCDSLTRYEFVGPHMGTLFRLVFFAADEPKAKSAAAAAFARIAELNRIFSDYAPDSEAVRLTHEPAGTAVKVSRPLFEVLLLSEQLTAASGGAFDVTVGPIVRLWREAQRTHRLPDQIRRAAARSATGAGKLQLDPTTRTVTLHADGMQLDFGGIAKGFAADEALAELARHGIRHAMVAASGDLALGEAPPGTEGWEVELAPFGRSVARPLRVTAANVGISTSGDAEQFVEIGGVRYSHIVDPGTGLGLTAPVAVSVIASRATLSDALATACSVLAATDAARIAACVGDSARALVMWRGDDGAIRRTSHGVNPLGLKRACEF